MFVADGVQGLAGAKQPKYYGKSYLRLFLGICVILLSIGALTYSIVINALGPQVRVERATYACDDGEISWDDFDSCECSSEVLYRDMFGATQDEAFENNRILTYYFLPYDLIGIYPQEYQSNLSFVNDFLEDYMNVNYGGPDTCEVVPFRNLQDPTPCLACSENPQTVNFDESVLACYNGRNSLWEENEAYRNMCVQDYEIYMDNIGGEARLFTYLSEAYYSWDAAMSQLVPPRTQFRWLRELPYGAPSLLFRDAMMTAATRAGRSPLIAPKTAWIRQNMFYRDFCDVCELVDCVKYEDVTGWDITLAAFAFAGGFISIFALLSAILYEIILKVSGQEGDLAVEDFNVKKKDSTWSLFGKQNDA